MNMKSQLWGTRVNISVKHLCSLLWPRGHVITSISIWVLTHLAFDQEVPDTSPPTWIHSTGRFVQNHSFGVAGEGQSHTEAPLHTAGERRHHGILYMPQVQIMQQPEIKSCGDAINWFLPGGNTFQMICNKQIQQHSPINFFLHSAFWETRFDGTIKLYVFSYCHAVKTNQNYYQ